MSLIMKALLALYEHHSHSAHTSQPLSLLGSPAPSQRLHQAIAFNTPFKCSPTYQTLIRLVRVRHTKQPLCSPCFDRCSTREPTPLLCVGFDGSHLLSQVVKIWLSQYDNPFSTKFVDYSDTEISYFLCLYRHSLINREHIAGR